MKTLLLITSCSKLEERAMNQIKNLTYFKTVLEQKNIIPYFLVNKDFNKKILKEFNYIEYNEEEKYTDLYKKLIYGFKQLYKKIDFDFLIKIDDDTFIDFNQINIGAYKDLDYIGYFIENDSNEGTILVNFLSILNSVNLYPPFCKELKNYAAGSCYILSKKAINIIINFLIPYNLDSYYINEDQLCGYIMQANKVITRDISIKTPFTKTNNIFLTEFSAHPISNIIFKKLIGKSLNSLENIYTKFCMTSAGIREHNTYNLKEVILSSIKNYKNSANRYIIK